MIKNNLLIQAIGEIQDRLPTAIFCGRVSFEAYGVFDSEAPPHDVDIIIPDNTDLSGRGFNKIERPNPSTGDMETVWNIEIPCSVKVDVCSESEFEKMTRLYKDIDMWDAVNRKWRIIKVAHPYYSVWWKQKFLEGYANATKPLSPKALLGREKHSEHVRLYKEWIGYEEEENTDSGLPF